MDTVTLRNRKEGGLLGTSEAQIKTVEERISVSSESGQARVKVKNSHCFCCCFHRLIANFRSFMEQEVWLKTGRFPHQTH